MTGPSLPTARPALSRSLVYAAAVLAPLVVAAALVPFRDDIVPTNGALLLVLVVVAVSATGQRAAAVLAALSAGLWFDFFLTEPYESLTINARADIETTVLLVLVAVAVAEVAAWGRRQQARAARDAGFLAGINAAAAAVSSGTSSAAQLDVIAAEIARVLHLERCRFDYGMGLHYARLESDGRVVRDGKALPVDSEGLPTDKDLELLVERGGVFVGRFLLTAGPDSRPSRTERLVAVALATQAAAVLPSPSPADR